MRIFGPFVAFLTLLIPVAGAQEIDVPDGAVIRSAVVSGLDGDRLSQELRRDINALVGDPLDREHLRRLADRIEREHPDVVVATRGIAAPDNGARIVFLVARIGGDRNLEANINARYTIESVDLEGSSEIEISQQLQTDLQALVGSRLDHDVVQRLEERLASELSGHEVRRRISRGSQRGRIRLVFDVDRGEALRWLRFAPTRSKLLYHADQGWSGFLNIPIGSRDHRVTAFFALDDADDLIEEYSGFGIRVESRQVASERLGVGLELSRFNQTWRPETLAAVAADASIPEAYRVRSTVSPWITFAVTPRLRATVGVSVSELESLSRSPESQMASALTGAVSFDQRWELTSGWDHALEASFAWRSATTALESDLDYQRYVGTGGYHVRKGNTDLLTSAAIGYISGDAPLFERFALGDSTTLRGWNKYDLSPAGGERMFHSSIELRNRGFALFLDAGSVWDRDTDSRSRFATGFGYHQNNGFLTLAFPLNTDDVGVTFMAGVRF
jgi:hypothetical protein